MEIMRKRSVIELHFLLYLYSMILGFVFFLFFLMLFVFFLVPYLFFGGGLFRLLVTGHLSNSYDFIYEVLHFLIYPTVLSFSVWLCAKFLMCKGNALYMTIASFSFYFFFGFLIFNTFSFLFYIPYILTPLLAVGFYKPRENEDL
ncbi:MAG: hypothetical protein A2430_01055 [Candidatus Liptonbacteria bacterium RIFOXYC1_FULL_36_8]|uniref:Uncharacterized protein n=3 Tax=Candidatus Liptoniibacteriota TaxID=1817909 RepID=A0A1G2CP10_9BACT|nr:MAG: hypothetical protein A2430_01055 [Candidatus Liptonbacteria bacterium RIFOXYC1_FULL_36_8]OGZ03079.1 MAG: hypothetical protein A2390_02550 [Candidatus Liptonbacteria bacterium RIFOXYB1_FULL_36_10]OGZ03873.1 MAG: hypothetical protein A2604_01150 [Candidatus Liptonbacteria bacterium RIFOXYD1_FULL_36_11]